MSTIGTDVDVRAPAEALVTADSRDAWSDKQIALIARTVAKGATGEELHFFLQVAARYNLDPFQNEIYCAKTRGENGSEGRMMILVGEQGRLKVANRYPDYRGYRSDVVCENDRFMKLSDPKEIPGVPGGYTYVEHSYSMGGAASDGSVENGGRGKIIGGWCEVYREGRTPTFFYAPLSDYMPNPDSVSDKAKKFIPWFKTESRMIVKCFDSETEVLTDQGFQRFSEVTGRVMQVTDAGIEPCGAVPFRQDYDGPMIVYPGRDLNFAVTPNHDMLTSHGKIEAWQMYDMARWQSSPVSVPMGVALGRAEDEAITDEAIKLSAAYLCDGYDRGQDAFEVAVSKSRKIAHLDSLAMHGASATRLRDDRPNRGGIRTTTPVHEYCYVMDDCGGLVSAGKRVNTGMLLSLSQRQAQVFVETMLAFDGSASTYYTTRPDHAGAFELAVVLAGWSVAPRRSLPRSPIGKKTCFKLYVSKVPSRRVKRVSRSYRSRGGTAETRARQLGRQSLTVEQNRDGSVWCVTVPSGLIVVRRHGQSMVCGNCAISTAFRMAFSLAGIYGEEEIEHLRRQSVEGSAPTLADEIEWGDAEDVADRMRSLVAAANNAKAGAYPDAKVRLLLAGLSDDERVALAAQEIIPFIHAHGGTVPEAGDLVADMSEADYEPPDGDGETGGMPLADTDVAGDEQEADEEDRLPGLED